jgi:hypothetical protein
LAPQLQHLDLAAGLGRHERHGERKDDADDEQALHWRRILAPAGPPYDRRPEALLYEA